jgi:excisionase family DNA binding protein
MRFRPFKGLKSVASARDRQGEHAVQRLLTVKEAAELLACSEAAVRKWIYQQRLPKVKVGRLTRLRLSDVEALMSEGLGER